MTIHIRRMEERDVEAGLRLTQGQNWSHRLADWEFHFRLGRGWVACDADDRVVASALWWAYGETFGTMGLIVVDPAYQGRGIGAQLVNAVLNDAGASRTLQLIATQAGFKLYERCGFRERGGIEQHQGTVAAIPAVAAPPFVTLREIVRDDLPALAKLDAAAVGGDRRAVIGAVLDVVQRAVERLPPAIAGAAALSPASGAALSAATFGGIVAERDGNVVGFALMRESGRGVLIGPVIAPDDNLATVLVSQLVSRVHGFVRIDVPTDAARLRAWLDSVGMPSIDHVTPMVRAGAPASGATLASSATLAHDAGLAKDTAPVGTPAPRVFALTSQALN